MIGLLGALPQELLDQADSATLCSFYIAQGVYDSTSNDDDDAAGPLVIFADCKSSFPGEFKHSQLIPSEAFTFSDLTPFLQRGG